MKVLSSYNNEITFRNLRNILTNVIIHASVYFINFIRSFNLKNVYGIMDVEQF